MKNIMNPVAVGAALVGASVGVCTAADFAGDKDTEAQNDSVLAKLGLDTACTAGESADLDGAALDADQANWNNPVFYLANNRDPSPEELVTTLGSSSGFSQSVDAQPSAIHSLPDEDIVVHAVYDSDSPTTTGLALRVHFDSRKLVWSGFEQVLQTNFVESWPPLIDDADYDHDADTDRYVSIQWSTLAGTWPGSIPIGLFDARFQVSPSVTEDTVTRVNFSAIYTAEDRPLLQTPATIEISECPIVLDTDCNQQVDALTDGVLNLRYEIGLRDAALIHEAVGVNCKRCDATKIEAYLQSLSQINAP